MRQLPELPELPFFGVAQTSEQVSQRQVSRGPLPFLPFLLLLPLFQATTM
jgi:hypothetical protein